MKAYVNPVVKTATNGLQYREYEVKANGSVFGTYHTAHTAGEVAKAINRASPTRIVGMVLHHHGHNRENG